MAHSHNGHLGAVHNIPDDMVSVQELAVMWRYPVSYVIGQVATGELRAYLHLADVAANIEMMEGEGSRPLTPEEQQEQLDFMRALIVDIRRAPLPDEWGAWAEASDPMKRRARRNGGPEKHDWDDLDLEAGEDDED